MGGFGGPDALAAWLSENGIAAVVDATHPFAQRISELGRDGLRARRACPCSGSSARAGRSTPATTGTGSATRPRRPQPSPGSGDAVFLTTGRQGLAAFAGLSETWFLVRCIDPPEPPLPPACEVLLDRGPYDLAGELALIDRHGLDLLVTKDSGGELTAAKLEAARLRGLPVIVIRRPPAARDRDGTRCRGCPRLAGRRAVRRLLLIGIGAGDPEHVTAQAIRALNEVDVFFVVEKGDEKHDLVDLRREICERYIERPAYRTVELRDPERDRTAAAYGDAVEAWRHARARALRRGDRARAGARRVRRVHGLGRSRALRQHARDRRGDPRAAIPSFEYEVVPGISSVQALAARHRIALNRIGRPIQITTGRRLSEGLHDDAGDVVVMLDAGCAFRRFAGQPVDIYWGAYIGTPDEILIAGAVAEVADEIERVRAEARERKGWIMDTYLLRRRRLSPDSRAACRRAPRRSRRAVTRVCDEPISRIVRMSTAAGRTPPSVAIVDRLLVAADGARDDDGRLARAVAAAARLARAPSCSRRVCEAGL